MEYKDLVEELRMVASLDGFCYDCTQCVNAANAIEALLAERDAAINELKNRVGCSSCAYFGDSPFEEPCCSCRKESNWIWEWDKKKED